MCFSSVHNPESPRAAAALSPPQVAALGQFIFGCFRSAVAVRETAVAAVYSKCLRLTTSAIGAPSPGARSTAPQPPFSDYTFRWGMSVPSGSKSSERSLESDQPHNPGDGSVKGLEALRRLVGQHARVATRPSLGRILRAWEAATARPRSW